jgi:hypothetical protein
MNRTRSRARIHRINLGHAMVVIARLRRRTRLSSPKSLVKAREAHTGLPAPTSTFGPFAGSPSRCP